MTLEFVTVFHKNAPIPGVRYGGKECESSGTALRCPAEALCPTGHNVSDMACERLTIRSIIWLDKRKEIPVKKYLILSECDKKDTLF